MQAKGERLRAELSGPGARGLESQRQGNQLGGEPVSDRLEAGLGRRATVIGLTAHAMPEDRQVCLDAGMDEYLAKPINRNALTRVLGEVRKTA